MRGAGRRGAGRPSELRPRAEWHAESGLQGRWGDSQRGCSGEVKLGGGGRGWEYQRGKRDEDEEGGQLLQSGRQADKAVAGGAKDEAKGGLQICFGQ